MARACDFDQLTPTGVVCPRCREGELDPARGRYGPIYRCSHKGCDFWLRSRPTGRKCSYRRDRKRCGQLMIEGTKTIPERCSDRGCPNHNPHKLPAPGRRAKESR